jgi:hypothetical protein
LASAAALGAECRPAIGRYVAVNPGTEVAYLSEHTVQALLWKRKQNYIKWITEIRSPSINSMCDSYFNH